MVCTDLAENVACHEETSGPWEDASHFPALVCTATSVSCALNAFLGNSSMYFLHALVDVPKH